MFSFSLLMVILGGIFFAVLGLTYKMSGVYRCRSMAFSSVFLFIATVLAGGRACFEPVQWSDWRLWGLGVTMGSVLYATITLVVRVNRLGSASISRPLINLSSSFQFCWPPCFWVSHSEESTSLCSLCLSLCCWRCATDWFSSRPLQRIH